MQEPNWTRPPVVGRRFGSERIVLDGMRFVDCTFEGSSLAYFGGPPPQLERCRFTGVEFSFAGPARHTIQTLQWLIGQGLVPGI